MKYTASTVLPSVLILLTLLFPTVLPAASDAAGSATGLYVVEFTEAPLDVYQGEVAIAAEFASSEAARAAGTAATVTAQACSDTVCYPPAQLRVEVR